MKKSGKKGAEDQKVKAKQLVAYKYSRKGKSDLHEAITLAGLSVFLKYENGEIKTVASRIIKPPNAEDYPYEPFEFANVQEVKSFVDIAKKESVNSLYDKAKSIVSMYNDQDVHVIVLLAADIIWSYFQDRFSTTHYLGIFGGNGSGKSTIGE